jgi:hypothetical protein
MYDKMSERERGREIGPRFCVYLTSKKSAGTCNSIAPPNSSRFCSFIGEPVIVVSVTSHAGRDQLYSFLCTTLAICIKMQDDLASAFSINRYFIDVTVG